MLFDFPFSVPVGLGNHEETPSKNPTGPGSVKLDEKTKN